MNTASELIRLRDDLAGHWTDSVLGLLKAAGWQRISVDMELQAWHVVKSVLRAELSWMQAIRLPIIVSLSTLMERVLRRSAARLMKRIDADSLTPGFKMQVRRLASGLRATPTERALYARIIRQPALQAAFKPLSRTDFVPRLHVSGAGR